MENSGSGQSNEVRMALLEFRVTVLWRFMQGTMGLVLTGIGGALLKLVLKG